MNNFKQFIINLVIGFAAINLFGWAFCRGTSFPFPIPKTTTVIVPFSIP